MSYARRRILISEICGFALIILSCWLTEIVDPPFSLQQVVFETLVIALVGTMTVYWSSNLITKIKHLEGFLVICAACKKVRIENEWVSIEHLIMTKSDLVLSHSTCPECTERLYGDILRNHGTSKNA